MKYYGLPCPVCGIVMNESDDIVVCPECATPHHRECWFKNGRCINSELHSETFVWSPDSSPSGSETSAPDNKTEATADTARAESSPDDGSVICHICGSENPADALHCGSCGALFGQAEELPKKECPFCGAKNHQNALRCQSCGNFLAQSEGNPFMNGVGADENEKIGDYTAGDYSLFTQLNAKRYIPKFRKITNKKVTFNWAAFLFGPQWFLFRKMYKIGILLMISFIAVSMMCTPLVNHLDAAYAELLATTGIAAEDIVSPMQLLSIVDEETMMEFTRKAAAPSFIISGISLAQMLLCGFLADKLYFKKVQTELNLIGETVDNEGLRKMMIVRRGSVSFLAYFAGSLGEQVIMNLFILAADKLSSII